MKSSLSVLYGVLLVLILTTCSKKPIALSSNSGRSLETAGLDIATLDFTYLSARSRVKYQDQATNFSATANIRILKDSLIWFSLSSSIGIEAVRGLISKDSIVIIDRLKKTYISYNFESLGTEFNFPLDFEIVQGMLLGKMARPVSDSATVTKEKGFLVLEQDEGSILVRNFIDRKDLILKKMEFSQNPKPNKLSLEFGNFKSINDLIFPYHSQVKVDYADEGNILNTDIRIDYSKVLVDDKPLKFPFSIPSKYVPK